MIAAREPTSLRLIVARVKGSYLVLGARRCGSTLWVLTRRYLSVGAENGHANGGSICAPCFNMRLFYTRGKHAATLRRSTVAPAHSSYPGL